MMRQYYVRFLFISGTFAAQTGLFAAPNSTVLQMGRVDRQTLGCTVTETTVTSQDELRFYNSQLDVQGFSTAPAIRDPQTGEWLNIKNEPLFVYPPQSGDRATDAIITVHLMHKQYQLPWLNNIGIGSSAIGTFRDEPFDFSYKLQYIIAEGKEQDLTRTINVNYYQACKLKFNAKTHKWEILKEN